MQVKFMRARVDPLPQFPGEEVSLDTERAAFAMMMMAESGWLTCCAACGTEENVERGGIVTTEDGRKYVYRLCQRCERAWTDENSKKPGMPLPSNVIPLHGEAKHSSGRRFATRSHEGRVSKRVDEALALFVANGEPEPEGYRES